MSAIQFNCSCACYLYDIVTSWLYLVLRFSSGVMLLNANVTKSLRLCLHQEFSEENKNKNENGK